MTGGAQLAREAALAFRTGAQAAGNDALARFVDTLVNDLQSGHLSCPVQELEGMLNELFAAQQRGNWLWVADILEYRLIPLTG